MRFSTVGTSWITQAFLSAAKQAGWGYASAYSRDRARAEAFAEQNGAGGSCSDFADLLRGDCDIVYIASPNSLHFEQIMLCLEAGRHVVCEKPIVASPAEYEAAYRLAREKNVYLFEALRHINSKGFSIVRDSIEKIAPVRNVILSYNQYSSKYDALKAGGAIPNVFNPAYGGGVLMDLGVYPISFAAALWGLPERAYYLSVSLESGVDGVGTAALSYDGFLCNITFSKIAEGFTENEIMGENGTLVFDRASELNQIRLYRGHAEEAEILYDVETANTLAEEVAVFDRIIREGDAEAYERLCEISRNTVRIMAEAVRL